jgi:DNA-binding phage protein
LRSRRGDLPRLNRHGFLRHLDSEAVIAEYLAAALDDPNPDMFLRAVANVAEALTVTT